MAERSILYQILTQPVTVSAPVTEANWHQPLSEPMRRRGLITAIIAATTVIGPSFVPNPVPVPTVASWGQPHNNNPIRRGGLTTAAAATTITGPSFVPNPVPPPSVDGWHGQISQPTLRKGPNAALQAPSLAFVGSDPARDNRWFMPLAEPVRRKPTVHPDAQAWSYYTPASTEIVTVDKWFHPLGQPALPRRGLAAFQQPYLAFVKADPFPETVSADRWQQPLSEPVRRKRANQPDALSWGYSTPSSEIVTLDKWHQPLSVPVRRGGLTTAQQASGEAPLVITDGACAFQEGAFQGDAFQVCTEFPKWLQPLSVPVRRGGLSAAIQASGAVYPAAVVVAETITVDKWLQPFSVPVRRKADVSAPSICEPPSELLRPDKWYQPLSEPMRRRGARVQQQDEFFFVGSDPATDSRAFVPLSEPVRRKPTVQPNGLTYGHYLPAVTDYFSAHVPLSEPVRRKPTIHPEAQAWSYFTPASTEVVTVDKWFVPASQPVLPKRGLAAWQQPYLAFVKSDPFPETVSADRWQQPLSEPVRRRGARVQQQDEFFFVGSDPATDTRSFAPLAVPVRRKPTVQPDGLTYANYTPAVTDYFDTHARLAEPVRRKPTIQPDGLTWGYVAPEIVTVDKWFTPASQPVLPKRGLATYEQPTLSFVPAAPFAETVTESRWHQPLAEPVRRKNFAEHPAYFPAAYYFPPNPDITVEKWHAPLAVPVRRKMLPVSEQPYLSFVKAAPFGETITLDKWYAPLSRPQVLRKALNAPYLFLVQVTVAPVTEPPPGGGDEPRLKTKKRKQPPPLAHEVAPPATPAPIAPKPLPLPRLAAVATAPTPPPADLRGVAITDHRQVEAAMLDAADARAAIDALTRDVQDAQDALDALDALAKFES